MNKNIFNYETLALDEEKGALVILNQTKLPGEIELLELTTLQDVWQAIRALQVRGAPAIGLAAASGLYLAARNINTIDFEAFYTLFTEAKAYLATSRPTAVNLFWALDRMEKVLLANKEEPVPRIKELLREEALKMKEEDVRACKIIGEHGLALLKDGDGILTHCNAGCLAACEYGTALAPIHLGRERGYNFKVFACETRPLLQGARLTAFELTASGIDTTLICDSMASKVMKNGWVQAVFVGCDRLAANGDACNKIGTSALAILARYYGIPFYVCAPASTIDPRTASGEDILIEEREAREITEMWYERRMAPLGVKAYNPAFDVTPNALITAVITEHGVIRAPYDEGIRKILGFCS